MKRRTRTPPSGVRRGAARRPTPRAGRRSTESVTLDDVAKIAGVSAITVSRVVNRPELVAPATVEHVQRAIARTGYVPNLLAGGLASRRSRLVAALVPTVANSIFIEMIQSLTDTLWAARYQVVLGLTGYSEREDALVTAILSRRPDALFVVGVNHSAESRRRILAARIPVVEAWDLTSAPLDMVVGFSHEMVGAAIADHLVGKGYRRIASVSTDDERAMRRRAGFLAALARHGLEEAGAAMVKPPTTLRTGRQGLASLLDRGVPLDAVACSSDAIAHGALYEAQSRNIQVAGQLGIIGFGDLDFAAETAPALSTVRIDRAAIGRIAAQSLLARIEDGPAPDRVIDVGFEIVARGTT